MFAWKRGHKDLPALFLVESLKSYKTKNLDSCVLLHRQRGLCDRRLFMQHSRSVSHYESGVYTKTSYTNEVSRFVKPVVGLFLYLLFWSTAAISLVENSIPDHHILTHRSARLVQSEYQAGIERYFQQSQDFSSF